MLDFRRDRVEALRNQNAWKIEWIGLSKRQFADTLRNYDELILEWEKKGAKPSVILSEGKLELFGRSLSE